MSSRLRTILFVIFAPLAVPAYLLFVALAQLIGMAFYIVVEATAVPLARRPITLSRGRMILLAVPVLIAAPVAAAVHLVIFALRWVVKALIAAGCWQTGLRAGWTTFVLGFLWSCVAVWSTLACLNAAMGASLIGLRMEGRDLYVESLIRDRELRHLPPEVQTRREQLLAELGAEKKGIHPEWETLQLALRDDECKVRWLPDVVQRKLTGMPWYFEPAELSDDGSDHSALLLGPLLFVAVLLVRWPKSFSVIRGRVARTAWFFLRIGVAAWSIYYLLTWMPKTHYLRYPFDRVDEALPRSFVLLSPAYWLGADFVRWVRPEWVLFNAGVWLVLIGAAAAIWWAGWRLSPLLGWPRYYVTFLAARLLQRKRIAFFSVGAVTLCVAMMIIVISVMGGFVDSIRQRAHGLLGDLVFDAGPQGFPYYQGYIDYISKLRDKKTGQNLVVQATPLIRSYGILQFPTTKKTAAVSIVGIKLEEYVRVNEFGKDLFYHNRFRDTHLGLQKQPIYGRDQNGVAVLPGDMEAGYRAYLESLPKDKREEEQKKYHRAPGDLYPGPGVIKGPFEHPAYDGREYPGVIIGRSILFRRQASGEYSRSERYPRGEACMLTVLPITRGGDISPEPPPKPAFRYVDDSRTGIHEIDSQNVYVDFAKLQQILSMDEQPKEGGGKAPARCNQILIKIAPSLAPNREKLSAVKEEIWQAWQEYRADLPSDRYDEDMLRQVDVSTWEEMQHSFISAIEKEKFLVLIMFGVISIVAVFLILCIFYMIVQEKTRDIGIVKSVGGSAEGVTAVFLAYGGAIGLVGCILGSLLGITFVEHINDVQDWLARLNPNWRVWSPETYSFDKIPDVWKWSEVIGICILAIVSSVIGATFPAIRAGKTWPVESLRYE